MEVREELRAESRVKGAVMVRVTLDGSERAIWSSLLVVAVRKVGVKEREETGVCSVAKLFELYAVIWRSTCEPLTWKFWMLATEKEMEGAGRVGAKMQGERVGVGQAR